MFNKNIKKELFTGLAVVTLFAPLALGNGQAHASDLDNAFSKTSNEKSVQQGNEIDQERGQWAKDHASEIEDPNDWKAGDQGEPVSSNTTNHTSSNSNSSSNDDGEGSYTPVTNTEPKQSDTNHYHTSSPSTTKKDTQVSYPNEPKNKRKVSYNTNQVAQKLRYYEKDIHKTSTRKKLVALTKRPNNLTNHKNRKELQKLTKYIHGFKNRHAYRHDIHQL